jgi:hypothetical protein
VRWGLFSALAVLIIAGCGTAPRPVAYTDLTRAVGTLEFTRITRELFRSRADLVAVYLVAAGPRSSTGYELRIERVQDQGDHVMVVVREDTPSLGDPVEARVTYPFRLIALPRTGEPVKLKWPGRP